MIKKYNESWFNDDQDTAKGIYKHISSSDISESDITKQEYNQSTLPPEIRDNASNQGVTVNGYNTNLTIYSIKLDDFNIQSIKSSDKNWVLDSYLIIMLFWMLVG